MDSNCFIVGQVILGEISKKCQGAGICKVLVDMEKLVLSSGYCQKYQGKAKITKEYEDRLVFAFDKSSMSEETIARFFSKPKFVVGTSYLLDQEICRQLDVKKGLIREGEYIIHDHASTFEIRFKIHFLEEKVPSSDLFSNKRWIINQ
ncbi:MAG: hypothetical protein HC892_00660 [Saprospiraceae bacterium]|nr:hypothetical protein [Saprospiraceae bacterium]